MFYQSDYDHPPKVLSLVDKSRNAAVLYNRASKTVYGEFWFNTFQGNLINDEKNKTWFSDSWRQYKFGDSAQVTVITATTIPVFLTRVRIWQMPT